MTNFRNLAEGYTRLSEICMEAATLQEKLGAIEVNIPTRISTTRRGPGRPAKKANGGAKANPVVAKVQGWLTEKGVSTFTPKDILSAKVANRAQLTPALKFMVEHGLAQKAGHGRYSTANVAHA